MIPLPEVTLGNDEPLYNIGVVARMTGVSMATLRAWERRYNFPESERTAGGHRLYSERDVLRLRWVKERIDDGMQTAQAINALRHQEHTGSLSLVEPLRIGIDRPLAARAHPPIIGAHIPKLKDNLVEALLQRDLGDADLVMGEAMAISNPEDLILDVMGPALAEVGEAWEAGKINVATEHLATNYIRHRLLMWMVSGPPPRATGPILLACAPNEWHEGGLLILGALLRRRRWPVAYLGQALPLPDLANIVKEIRPSMVVLIAMTENAASELSEWPQWLPEVAQSGKPPLGYGGRVFRMQPEWRSRLAGLYLGDDFREGLGNIERTLEGLH